MMINCSYYSGFYYTLQKFSPVAKLIFLGFSPYTLISTLLGLSCIFFQLIDRTIPMTAPRIFFFRVRQL